MTVFSFYSYISCTYFVRIILKHFVWGSVNVNGTVSLVAHIIKNLPAMKETWVPSLSQEDSLEKGCLSTSVFLENSMDREAWPAIVHGFIKTQA